MSEGDLPRLRATCGANRGVITKLISEADTILENATSELDIKTKNKLTRIEEMLQEKSKLVSDLDEKIASVCKVEEIEKEIDEAETLKMRVMDALVPHDNALKYEYNLHDNRWIRGTIYRKQPFYSDRFTIDASFESSHTNNGISSSFFSSSFAESNFPT